MLLTPYRALALAAIAALSATACRRDIDRAPVAHTATPTAAPTAASTTTPTTVARFHCRSDDACSPLRCDIDSGDCRNQPRCTRHDDCLPGWLCEQGVGDTGEAAGFVYRCRQSACQRDPLDDDLRTRSPFREAFMIEPTPTAAGAPATFSADGLTVCPHDYDRFRVRLPAAAALTVDLRIDPDLRRVPLRLLVLSPVAADASGACTTQQRSADRELRIELPRDVCLLHDNAAPSRFIEFYVQRAEGAAIEAEGRYGLAVEVVEDVEDH